MNSIDKIINILISKKIIKAIALCGWILPLSLWSSHSLAEAIQDQEILHATAKTFLEQQLEAYPANETDVEIGDVDPRLRLVACDSPLEAFLPTGAHLLGKLTVGIRCQTPKPWTVYLASQIRIYKDVVAAAHPLNRGSIVGKEDVMVIRQEISDRYSAYFEDADQVIGQTVTRAINRGQLFTANRLKAPVLIRRGEEVTILSASRNLEVRSRGKALKDAALGEVLTVKNNRSKRIIQVIAVEAGTVKVNL